MNICAHLNNFLHHKNKIEISNNAKKDLKNKKRN